MARFEAGDSTNADDTYQEHAGAGAPSSAGRLVHGAVLAGKYRLELPLGQGGMAVVWSAYHLELQIPVAIKLLRRGHDPRLAQRLKLEARAAARIAHPAIVRVLDVATTEDGDPFIVMELLTGETLADALARGNISALRVVQLLLPIVEGLALVHDHGVVHRDLKPENVLLAMDGEQLQPKLLDFGIAKLADGEAAVRLTKNGMTLGSPSYMSPEQARGEPVDHLSDVWSFCVLLYKSVGGKAPFRGATARDTLDAILEREPPPLPRGAGVDGHLARIVLSGLHKSPAARPASMRVLGQQLARWLLLHGVSVDACGAPLVTKWLSSELPAKPRASARPSPRMPPPPSSRRMTNEATTSELAKVAPPARSVEPMGLSDRRSSVRKHRRWVLWALAGVLLAGGSLALTRPGVPEASEPMTLRPSSLGDPESKVLSVRDDSRGSEQPLAQPLAATTLTANTLTANSLADPSTPRSDAAARTAAPRTTATAAPTAQPAKNPAPTARPTLPF
jgi:eukaryotic-like serine/threonine-protein kinase